MFKFIEIREDNGKVSLLNLVNVLGIFPDSNDGEKTIVSTIIPGEESILHYDIKYEDFVKIFSVGLNASSS